MTYDPIDQYVVLFGGCGHLCSMNDTWTFAGGGWTDHTGTTIHTPSGRSSAAMTWDAKDGYVLMFGGINQSGFLQDTWGFQGGDWKNLLPAKGGHAVPPPRFGGSMVYDAADGYVVLFGGGGFYQDRTLLNDTWSYVASVWTKEAPALSPSIRAYSAMDYDASLGKVLLFGGEENTIFSGDTWEYSAGVWDHKFPGKAPSPRQGATLVYDAAISGSLLFGGMSKYGFVNDTWLFRGGNWSQVAYTGSPTPGTRTWATGAYDSSDQEVILVGGWALGTLYGDYWGFGNGTSL